MVVGIGNRHPIETKFGHRAVIFHARGAGTFLRSFNFSAYGSHVHAHNMDDAIEIGNKNGPFSSNQKSLFV